MGPQAATPLLDSMWFPHITDKILDHLVNDVAVVDPVACLKLQGIGRKWQTRLKQRIFSHLELTVCYESNSYRVTTLPKSVVVCNVVNLRLWPRKLSNILPLAKALDINGSLPRKLMNIVSAQAKNLNIVRFREVTEMVNWWPVYRSRADVAIVITASCQIRRNPSYARLAPDNDMVGEKLNNFQVWVYPESLTCWSLPYFWGRSLRPAKVVLMFSRPQQHPNDIFYLNSHVSIMLRVLHMDVILVLDWGQDVDGDQIKQDLLGQAHHRGRALKFVTHDEYRQEVGEKTYELHHMIK